MLQITQRQIDGLASARRDEFRLQLIEHCRHRLPLLTSRLATGDLERAVTQAMEHCH